MNEIPGPTSSEKKKPHKKPTYSPNHDDLVRRAEAWLRHVGCSVVLRELVTNVRGGEIPDAIGWRQGISVLIECKTSRGDFTADRHKWFRHFSDMGMGDWRFFICPVGLLAPSEIPDGWGLLEATKGRIKLIHGGPEKKWGAFLWGAPRFKANKRNETIMLVSALRRIEQRGHFDLIYENVSGKDSKADDQLGACHPPFSSDQDSAGDQNSLPPSIAVCLPESQLQTPPLAS